MASDTGRSRVVKVEPLENANAKWIRLLFSPVPPSATHLLQNHVHRSRRQAAHVGVFGAPDAAGGSDIDGVGIVALLDGEGGTQILLQKQYRAPLDKIVIEVPAGLVDEGETAEEAAIRELREETGYIGVVQEGMTSPVMWNDPGFCTTNLRMVHVRVDMSLPENQNPKTQLEENEFIETFMIGVEGLWEACKRWEAEGYAIDARVGTLAEGLEVARRLRGKVG